MPNMPVALTVAGSDSGGGAGIQADLKTFTMLGVFGTSAVTALTAQNTLGVQDIHAVPPAFVAAQIDSVADDLQPRAAKTGMLFSVELIETVTDRLRAHDIPSIVVDPVMVAASGDRLIEPEAEQAILDVLVPVATVITPNIAEAALLAGVELDAHDLPALRDAARAVIDRGAAAVVVKGGRDGDHSVDVFHDGRQFDEFRQPFVDTPNRHGTGCTFSAAIAAGLAKGLALADAIDLAKRYVTVSLEHAPGLGHGSGPTNHMAWLEHGR